MADGSKPHDATKKDTFKIFMQVNFLCAVFPMLYKVKMKAIKFSDDLSISSIILLPAPGIQAS